MKLPVPFPSRDVSNFRCIEFRAKLPGYFPGGKEDPLPEKYLKDLEHAHARYKLVQDQSKLNELV